MKRISHFKKSIPDGKRFLQAKARRFLCFTLISQVSPEKSSKHSPYLLATFTIQQVAGRSGLSEYTLRYYEKIGLIEPIPRDQSSGHRRYNVETAQRVEALACLRASSLSLDDMRRYLRLRERGDEAAAGQKALFAAHAEKVAEDIRQLQIRQRYLDGKVAYWDAQMEGDLQRAEQIAQANQEIVKELK